MPQKSASDTVENPMTRQKWRADNLKEAEEAVKNAYKNGNQTYIEEKELKHRRALHDTTSLCRCIAPGDYIDKADLSSHLILIAKQVEEAMQKAGAEPGVDYTFTDLFQIAAPIAVKLMPASVSFPFEDF